MALLKQNIDVLFTNGLNTKSDSKLTLGSNLLELENAIFNKDGRLDKRKGYTALGTADCTGGQPTNYNALLTYGDNELLLAADTNLYSYLPSISKWVNKATFRSTSVSSSQVVSNSDEQTKMDSCIVGSIIVYAWEDTSGGIRYSVQDTESDTFIIANDELDSAGSAPRCVAINKNIFIYYGNGNNLKYKYVPVGDPCNLVAGTTRSDVHGDFLYDFVSIGNLAYCFYKTTTAAEGRLVEINSVGTGTAVNTVVATIVDTLAISAYESNSVVYLNLVWKQTASLIKCAISAQSLLEIIAPKDLDTTASTDISKITLERTNSTTDQVTILYQTPGATVKDDLITSNTLDLDGTVGTPSVFVRSLGLASKLFLHEEVLYVNCLHESDLQATVFTLDSSAQVTAKFSAGNAGTHAAIGPLLPNVLSEGNGVYSTVINTKGQIRSENAVLFSRLGINLIQLDFQSQNTYTSSFLNDNLFVVGGVLNTYDGDSMVEQGFNLFPEDLTVSATPTTGGSMSDGTYQYKVLYKWIDAKGKTHLSAPSVALSQILTGGTATQRVSIDIPTLRVTKKTAPNTEATIEVYRTQDLGTVFYKVTSITSPTMNDPTADSITFTDTLADATIIGNEELYTTGGVLDNIAAPSCDLVTSHQNRLFIAGLQDKLEVRYSKITRTNEAPAFNEALSIKVDPTGGPITQIATMDSNLVIFKANNLYTVGGEGPSDTGAGATFTEPQLVSADVGCVDPNSVVLGPEGLYFKSSKGIYLLNRSLQTSYIGSPVEDFNSFTIVSAKLLNEVNEIRFSTTSGVTLVYNYFYKQWSVFTGQNAVDSVIWQNNFVYADSSNLVLVEDSSTHLDNGASVKMKISTGWVKLAGLQGYQRVYRATILGEYSTRHTLKATIYNDYSGRAEQTAIFDPVQQLSVDSGFYGDGVYGDMDVYGESDNGVYQFQMHMKKQKCQAVRIILEDLVDNGDEFGTGESLNISGVSFQIGAKSGTNKLRAGKKS